jgi:hypothetical protein
MRKLILLLLAGTLVFMTSCTTTKRKNFVVLIDPTLSIPETEMQRYITTIQETILPNMGEQDRLTIQFIDGCSQNKAERIYTIDLADMNFENNADGINHKADSARARLVQYVTQTVKNQIAEKILTKRKERKDCGSYTDIVSALNEAKYLIDSKKSYANNTDKIMNDVTGDENYKYETCLVVFSDMVNENPEKTLNFTTFGKLKEEAVAKKIDELKGVNKIPDLEEVKVLVYGATSTNNAGVLASKQIENVKLFWGLFFKSAGADLKGYGYDTQMELKEYLAAKR